MEVPEDGDSQLGSLWDIWMKLFYFIFTKKKNKAKSLLLSRVKTIFELAAWRDIFTRKVSTNVTHCILCKKKMCRFLVCARFVDPCPYCVPQFSASNDLQGGIKGWHYTQQWQILTLQAITGPLHHPSFQPEVEFLNSVELSLIKSSPLPAQLPRPGRS